MNISPDEVEEAWNIVRKSSTDNEWTVLDVKYYVGGLVVWRG